jgi:hypothetical protein
MRWLGIALITGGVGFIAGGPEITVHHHGKPAGDEDQSSVAAAVTGVEP